ncbi:MAG: hypothetical protein GF307_11530 [candidate division Zixibacteria bacterium]|nr:hypothetical protein [candidate division Zixibacteria bacterium]
MRRKVMILPLLMLGLTMIFAGCSENNGVDGNSNFDNEGLSFARADADTAVTEFIDDSQDVSDWVVWDERPMGMGDSVVFDTTDYWHIYIREYINGRIEHSVADSFRYADTEGNYQYWRDENTNQFERRLKREFHRDAWPETPGTSWDKSRSRNMLWVGLAEDVTTLNGDVHRYYHGQNSFREFTREFEGEFLEVKFNTEDLFNGRPTHPFEGTLAGSTWVDYEGQIREYHIEAEITVTFYPDHFHVIFRSGDNYFEWDHYYEP